MEGKWWPRGSWAWALCTHCPPPCGPLPGLKQAEHLTARFYKSGARAVLSCEHLALAGVSREVPWGAGPGPCLYPAHPQRHPLGSPGGARAQPGGSPGGWGACPSPRTPRQPRGQPTGPQPGAPLTWRRRSPRGPRRRSPPGRGRWTAGSSGTGTSRSSAPKTRVRGLLHPSPGRAGGLVRPSQARSPAPAANRPPSVPSRRRGIRKRKAAPEPLLGRGGWGEAGTEGGPPGLTGRALQLTPNSPQVGGRARSSLGDFSSLHTKSPTSPGPSGGPGPPQRSSGLSPPSPRPPGQHLPSSGAPPGG